MREKIFAILIISIFTLVSCVESMKIRQGFVSRIHKSTHQEDWFKLLGTSNLKKHIKDFENIDWDKEYWQQNKSNEYNNPDIEVIDEKNSIYLSISVVPDTFESYQFCIGIGTHKETIINEKINVERNIRLYLSGTDNISKPKEIIRLFFNREFKKIESEIKQMDFFFETEDNYLNLE